MLREVPAHRKRGGERDGDGFVGQVHQRLPLHCRWLPLHWLQRRHPAAATITTAREPDALAYRVRMTIMSDSRYGIRVQLLYDRTGT